MTHTRHWILRLGWVCALVWLLGACTASQPGTLTPTTTPTDEARLLPSPTLTATATPAPKVITLWHNWYSNQEQSYQAIIADFNASQSDIYVELLKVDDLSDALRVTIPNGEGPDIVRGKESVVGSYALAELIAPLDDTLDSTYLDTHFEPAAAQAMIWHAAIWGIPEAQDGIALIYNRDILSKDDLPDPDDFEDLMAQASRFREANPDKYYLCNQGLGSPNAYYVAPIYFGQGLADYGGYVDDHGIVYLQTPEAYAAAEWIQRFSKVAPAKVSPEVCQAMLIEGQAASWWTGARALQDLDAAGVNYGIAPMGSPFVDVTLFMLTQNALDRGHAEAALTVMQHLGSADVQQRLALTTGLIPANSEALAQPALQARAAITDFAAALHYGVPMPNHPYADCQWGVLGDATTAIWSGSQTPRGAMDEAQQAIEACIAEMRTP